MFCINPFLMSLCTNTSRDTDNNQMIHGKIINSNTIEYSGMKLYSTVRDKEPYGNTISVNNNMTRVCLHMERSDETNKVQVVFSMPISKLIIREIKCKWGMILHIRFRLKSSKLCDASINSNINDNSMVEITILDK